MPALETLPPHDAVAVADHDPGSPDSPPGGHALLTRQVDTREAPLGEQGDQGGLVPVARDHGYGSEPFQGKNGSRPILEMVIAAQNHHVLPGPDPQRFQPPTQTPG